MSRTILVRKTILTPIFHVAHYGIVGDAMEVVSAISHELQKNK